MTILVLILLLFIVISAVAALVVQQRRTFKKMKNDIPLKEDTVIWCPPRHQKEDESVDYDKALLSIVIPAYNEEERLPIMFEQTYYFLCHHRTEIVQLIESANSETTDFDTSASTTNNCRCDFEIVIVDDGSSDRTCDIVKTNLRQDMNNIQSQQNNDTDSSSSTTTTEKNQEQQADVLRLLSLNENRGKGAAVKVGMLHAKGSFILMADADGATDICDLFKLLNAMTTASASSTSEVVVLGSRAHLLDEHSDEVQASRSVIRTILMIGFHLCVRIFCSSNIRDTQCGFKLFSQTTARTLFGNLHIERWAFDIELVVLGELLNYKLVEIPVNWHEVDGSKLDSNSKLNLIWVSLSMLRDMILVRTCYTLGIWTLPSPSSISSTMSSEKKKQQ